MTNITQTHITKVATAMIPVADQDAAVDFYTSKLGFEKRVDVAYGDGERWVEVGPPGGEATLALTSMRGDDWTPGRMTGVSLVADDIDAAHAALREAGVDCDDVSRFGDPVPPMFWFRDQDANTLLIVG